MRNQNFVMVVIGQIISLFGNAILRFALPLYLLSETGSAALFGIVSACAFIPMIVLAPVGGIFADRVNKRNIMVVLDFSTAALVLCILLLLGKMDIVALIFTALFLLYGIQGAYQPAVQASIPALLSREHIMQGNAVINLVSSFSGLIGPVIGGTLFGFFGIRPILYVSLLCFLLSAVMEIFIRIPFEKKEGQGNIFLIGLKDLKESFIYMKDEQPLIMQFSLAVAAINMILSALMIIGMPVIVTQLLDFDSETANRLYGYAEGIMAAGSLCGGMGAGVLAGKMKAEKGYLLLFYDALTLIPIGLALMLSVPSIISYGILMVSCFVMMSLATLFSIQIMSYLQMIVSSDLIGKVISCAMCIGMCATPVGQAIYGGLFEILKGKVFGVFFIVTVLIVLLAFAMKKPFAGLAECIDKL
ncbi:MAG: MFS transporter [Frisingicoccus sp.]|uniref:MFS transporter n=1 Tax=Frisingicoccus sp. TaxID=1918627 RepID=UPI00260E27E9|nr:MFS transporter [Frisingicoccus sp.]MDD6232592.1 MFS transporter [Frisingicoccus sp.]